MKSLVLFLIYLSGISVSFADYAELKKEMQHKCGLVPKTLLSIGFEKASDSSETTGAVTFPTKSVKVTGTKECAGVSTGTNKLPIPKGCAFTVFVDQVECKCAPSSKSKSKLECHATSKVGYQGSNYDERLISIDTALEQLKNPCAIKNFKGANFVRKESDKKVAGSLETAESTEPIIQYSALCCEQGIDSCAVSAQDSLRNSCEFSTKNCKCSVVKNLATLKSKLVCRPTELQDEKISSIEANFTTKEAGTTTENAPSKKSVLGTKVK